ncbi:MAG: 30S ribosomal protein S17 [bacterium]|nr:30S ribosomal protein S17 [bacterium]
MEEKKINRLYSGEVVSDKMDKTIVVKTMRTYRDPRFHKIIKKTKKYKVHDEKQEAKIGDMVEFYEVSPISKTKYMHLARVIKTKIDQ